VAAVQRKQPVTPGRYRRAEPKELSAGQRPFVCAGKRPFSDTRIAELNARKRTLYVRANRATTAGRLTQMGYTAYRRPGLVACRRRAGCARGQASLASLARACKKLEHLRSRFSSDTLVVDVSALGLTWLIPRVRCIRKDKPLHWASLCLHFCE